MNELELLNTETTINQKKAILKAMNEVDIAEFFETLDPAEAVKLFRLLNKDKAADVFAYLSSDAQEELVQRFTDKEITSVMAELYADDATDFIEEMPANVVTRILKHTAPEKRAIINQLMNYPEDSIGSVMTVELVSLKLNDTVKSALDKIRKQAIDKETIYTLYVTSPERKLLGVVEARHLLSNQEDVLVKDIMSTDFVKAITTDDKERLVAIFNKYPLLALPVTDLEGRLVGIVTHDDAMQVIREEFSEDFELIGKLQTSDRPYLKDNPFHLAKNRFLWLMILMVSATLTGFIISSFEDAILVVPALVTFIPMLMDTGGNAGSQASTLIIRGIALEEIKPKDGFKIFLKEVSVSLIVGVGLAIVNFIRIWIMYDIRLAAVISITLIAVVFMAKTIGALLPLVAVKFKLDPALMVAPLITTIIDAGALIVFFLIAKLILGI
ncbi:MAG TPA: magnesium transporter [Bacilli bacterium]|nr:magnesium transporter [Bacilli bacterium]